MPYSTGTPLKTTALASSFLSIALLCEPAPAVAGNDFRTIAGGFVAGAIIGAALSGANRGGYYAPVRRVGGGGGGGREQTRGDRRYRDNADAPNSDTKNRVLASLAVPSDRQTVVLRGIVPAATLGAVGSTDDRDQVGKTKSKDSERDYAALISEIIQKLNVAEKEQKATGLGDVSEHAISQAVDDAYKNSNLVRFASFVGENWTLERLRVKILERVDSEIKSLQKGNNKGRVSMDDIRGVINRSAEIIYQRLFESSELLAANRSSTLFVQALYQTHGEAATGEVRESVERMLMQGASSVDGEFDPLIRRDARGYALGYRKERIVFDCLSDNIVKVSSAVQGIVEPAAIEIRIRDIAATECKDWLTNQFVTNDKKLSEQQPVPLRTVWTKSGPLDDPSMYSRAVGMF